MDGFKIARDRARREAHEVLLPHFEARVPPIPCSATGWTDVVLKVERVPLRTGPHGRLSTHTIHDSRGWWAAAVREHGEDAFMVGVVLLGGLLGLVSHCDSFGVQSSSIPPG